MLKVKVFYQGKSKIMEIPKSLTVKEFLSRININPETVLVKRDGEFVPDTEKVKHKDRIEILDVSMG